MEIERGRMLRLNSLFQLAPILALASFPVWSDESHVDRLVQEIEQNGKPPLEFVLSALDDHYLLIFDDALHSAVEPWLFYEELVQQPGFRKRARHIFIEIVAVNDQSHLDAYFSTYPENRELYFPALQNVHIRGWRYQTYADLFQTIHRVNAGLSEEERLIVHGVSTPSCWKEIESPADYAAQIGPAQLGRDNLMYSIIKDALHRLDGTERGIFLTNTRHAYTGLKDTEGDFYWNTATFFRQWHDNDATLSIRFNAPFLNIIKSIEESEEVATSQGLERYEYGWTRAADGDWDRAFERGGGQPVALPLAGTAFGEAPYVGNRMHRAQSGQTMADVNDVVIHLLRLEEWRQSAVYSDIYTPGFQSEIVRRYRAAYHPSEIERMLARNGVESLEEFVKLVAEPEPMTPQREAQLLDPLD